MWLCSKDILFMGIEIWILCNFHVSWCIPHSSEGFQPFKNINHQAPLSIGFSRQDYWSGLPFLPPGDLPDPGIEPASPAAPALAGGFLTIELCGKLYACTIWPSNCISGHFSQRNQDMCSHKNCMWMFVMSIAALFKINYPKLETIQMSFNWVNG